MGMFSWYKADIADTKIKVGEAQINIVEGDKFKILIPKEFGGGFIIGEYDGYGCCCCANGKVYDIYELVAFWNEETITNPDFQHSWDFAPETRDYSLQYAGEEKPLVPSESEYTDYNRNFGIDIACYDEQQEKLKYPIKLVSTRYTGTYEDCKDFSHSDPDQGFFRKY